MIAPHQIVILNNPPIILLSIQTRPTDQALNHEIAKFRINRRKSIPYKIYVPDVDYRRRRSGSLRRFCPITFSICSANRGGWTPDLEHGPTRQFEGDLRPLRKTYRARSRRLKYTCGPKGSTGQLPRKRPPSKPAAAQDRIYTPDGLGRVLKHRRGGLPIVNR